MDRKIFEGELSDKSTETILAFIRKKMQEDKKRNRKKDKREKPWQ